MTGAETIRDLLFLAVLIVWAVRVRGIYRGIEARADEGGIVARAKAWWRAPESKSDRGTFLFLTFVLLAMIGLRIPT